MQGGAFKMITTAALIGLVVMHADSFARLTSAASNTFRSAVRLA